MSLPNPVSPPLPTKKTKRKFVPKLAEREKQTSQPVASAACQAWAASLQHQIQHIRLSRIYLSIDTAAQEGSDLLWSGT